LQSDGYKGEAEYYYLAGAMLYSRLDWQESKDNLLKDILSNDARYIFINIFKENDKKYIKILDNSIHVVNFDDNHKQYTNFNMGVYMTKLIIQKHFNGDIYHKNIEYKYEHETLKGGEYTIVLS